MKKALIVLTVILLACDTAYASDWHKTDANSELTIYSDWDSVQKTYPFSQDKPVVSIWVKTEMVKPKTFKGFKDVPAVKTFKTRYSFQCAPRLSSDNTEWATYDAKNNLISSDAKPLAVDSFVSVIPDSMGDAIMRTACMKAFVNEIKEIDMEDRSEPNLAKVLQLYNEYPQQWKAMMEAGATDN